MMGIGLSETLLILGIALVVIGPDRFPTFAKLFMRTVNELRKYITETKEDIAREIEPIKKEMRDLSRYTSEIKDLGWKDDFHQYKSPKSPYPRERLPEPEHEEPVSDDPSDDTTASSSDGRPREDKETAEEDAP